MKLIDCYIENFGKLSDFKLSFSDGINTIKKDNGYGKTTLTVFIKAMLFGLDDTKKMKLEQNDRKHYMPWQGGRCGGSLTFETNGKKYRIERTFMPKAADDTLTVYDVKSGRVSYDFKENIGEELFGIDADGFERTVFLSEANLSGKNENKTVSAKLSNLVGCDGDLGVMDEAILLLEKQRKVYHRRGGAGEIGEIKAKRLDTERKINDLTRLKGVYIEEEERLSGITLELDKLYAEKKRLTKEARLADEARIKHTYEKQYAKMKESVECDERALTDLKAFFKNGLPTAEEIERRKELLARSKRIYSEQEREDESELRSLSDFFRCEMDELDFIRAKELSDGISEKRKEAEIIERTLSRFDSGAARRASKSDAEEKHAQKISTSKKPKKANRSCHIILFIGIIVLLLGIGAGLLINPAAYSLTAIGAIILIFGIINKSRKSEAFARRCEENINRARLDELNEEIMLAERDACEFIARFPRTDAKTVTESVNEILRKRDIYLALSEREKAITQRKEEQLSLAAGYRRDAEEFLGRFPTVSDRPFDEISAKLIEYATLSRSVERMRATLDAFAKEHGINPSEIISDRGERIVFSTDSTAIDSKISELERSKAITERQCKIISEELECEDELTAERDELLLKEREYEKRLGIILKTQKYLGEAKDILTSKYLSKTKTAFDKYVNIISRESGEDFHMDTSFAVMKNERGTLRQAEAYSRGTRDLYALAARFALIDSLYENESPFVILDDPFAYFDDAKLSRATAALSAIAKNRQIIYLTCASARKI